VAAQGSVGQGPVTGRRLGLLRVAMDQALGEVLAEVSPAHPELRPAHIQLFRLGGVEGATTVELAQHAGMTKQSMHELVTHLERNGYLTREPASGDSRAKVVRLTASGRALERDLHAAITTVLESWQARLGKERFDALWETLQEVTGERAPLPPLAELRRRTARHPPT
jgi:DNA-binding MarR family transcriptional regulator